MIDLPWYGKEILGLSVQIVPGFPHRSCLGSEARVNLVVVEEVLGLIIQLVQTIPKGFFSLINTLVCGSEFRVENAESVSESTISQVTNREDGLFWHGVVGDGLSDHDMIDLFCGKRSNTLLWKVLPSYSTD
jgi:hypothetical protein